MKFEKVDIDELIPAEYNPRKDLKPSDSEYQKIKKSIEEFGYVEPIIVNKDNTIIGGHQRLKVLKDLGYEEIDIVRIDIDKTKEKALNIALNKISGEWDFDKLGNILEELELEEFDLDITGFELDELDDILEIEKEVEEDDYEIVVPEEPKAKLGDIYQLGNHRLMCGDSTKEEDVSKLMNGNKADMVFTDPPWNVNYGGSDHPGWKQRTIKNDFMGTDEFKDFMYHSFKRMNESSKPGAMTYVVMSAQEWGNMMLTLAMNDYHWSSTIIWNKDRLVLSRKDYHTKYEPIWYGWKEGDKRLHPLKDRKQTDVWDIDRPSVSDLHPTTKPIELVSKAITNSSKTDDLVLDLFGGSGSTLISAEQLDRQEVEEAIKRIGGEVDIDLVIEQQDMHLQRNQEGKIRCGDNGIFKGVPLTDIEKELSKIARELYNKFNYDGKHILSDDKLIICQSNATEEDIRKVITTDKELVINPLGYWTGGINVDTGCTNRKLGSDMAQAVTGGGLHGKDLSKADVSVNIYAFIKAQETGKVQEFSCAIGDETIDEIPYEDIVKVAEEYINNLGGFEKFAEWGLF